MEQVQPKALDPLHYEEALTQLGYLRNTVISSSCLLLLTSTDVKQKLTIVKDTASNLRDIYDVRRSTKSRLEELETRDL